MKFNSENTLQYSKIVSKSFVDGPGERTAIFIQGCPLACRGCQSKHLWTSEGGISEYPYQMAAYLLTEGERITISGGEPFAQPEALAELIYYLHLLGAEHIIIYSGYTWDELHSPDHPANAYLDFILKRIDVLVDGRFVLELDDPTITYRGSRNQRPIDVQESLVEGRIVTQDWDDEIEITSDGNLVMPVGFSKIFEPVGNIQKSRRCGQSK
jgi:anaerobic ribonucleoside-triphosphate reductase activating protein